MNKNLVCGVVGQEQAVLVARHQVADYPALGHGAVDDRDAAVGQFCFEGGVEVLRGAHRHQAVFVGQLGEHAHFVGAFKLTTHGHVLYLTGNVLNLNSENKVCLMFFKAIFVLKNNVYAKHGSHSLN